MTITEQNEEPEIAKKKFKELRNFQNSKEWSSLVDAYNLKANTILNKIKKEIETRKKAVVTNTELEKLLSYIRFIETLISLIPDSEGGKVFKEELAIQVERGYSHVYGKVEIGFDTPMYTALDMLKNEYNACLTIGRKLSEILSLYEPQKETNNDLHPYED